MLASYQTPWFVTGDINFNGKVVIIDLYALDFAIFLINLYILYFNIVIDYVNIPEKWADSRKSLSVLRASVVTHHEWRISVIPYRP